MQFMTVLCFQLSPAFSIVITENRNSAQDMQCVHKYTSVYLHLKAKEDQIYRWKDGGELARSFLMEANTTLVLL